MQKAKYREFSAGRAGNGSVNLATGALTFVHEDTGSDENILPINISHVYSSKRAADADSTELAYGKGFRLNLQQTLRKTDPDSDTRYIYTDASGIEHTFEDRYYYITNEGKRVYVASLSNITIEADGKLTYKAGDTVFEVFLQQLSESGLTLQTELKPFKGSKKLETRHEDIVQLTEEISQLEKSIADLQYSIKQYDKPEAQNYKNLLNWQNQIEEKSIAIEKDSITQYNNLKADQAELIRLKDLAKNEGEISSIIEVNKQALKIDAQSLENQNFLMEQKSELNKIQHKLWVEKNSYDNKEREELNYRYVYLKGIAQKEIEKYTNLLGNKQDLLNKLNLQIPVNFITNKNNLTMGFNAEGNLVSLFDNYDNQIAIIYEDDVIVKVIDTDNREIIFNYQLKNSTRGKLVSVTDFKGHKTSFIYGAYSNDSSLGEEYLRKIEYPNGETSELIYTPDGLLSEMLAPSKIGVQLQYNEDQKVSSIAELTATEKIDKNGVLSGEKAAENIADLTYEGDTTVVHNIKNGISESNLFDVNGNLKRVQTMENNKIIDFTVYDESSISKTSRRCNFVMTADDIAENGISGKDIIKSTDDDSPVTLTGEIGETKKWEADVDRLDLNHADYILCGFATSPAAERTPMRKMTKYCKNHSAHDMNSTYRRFEYKVHVDYAGNTPTTPSPVYTPIETGDTINKLYIKNSFGNLPDSTGASNFFGGLVVNSLTNYYPIFGVGNFNVDNLSSQVFYTAKYYPLQFCYGCALWVGTFMLWCNDHYADKHKIPAGWKSSSISLSSWGPITVHHRGNIHKWGQFLSKDGIYHNGSSINPNYAKDNQNPDIDEFIAGFDYTTDKRQHVALPITLRKENGNPIKPKNITVIAHYKQSQGEAVFEKPTLTKGKVAYSLLNESGNVVFESVSDPDKITANNQSGSCSTVLSSVATEYDDNNLPTEKRTIYTYVTKNGTSEQTAVEKWFYNSQGSVIEHWNYIEGEELASGIDITETVYDERGNAVKSFAYNSLDASTKFYREQERTKTGRVLSALDETGIHKTSYEYDDVTGIVKTVTAPNGGKFSYGHDTNTDAVTAITQSTDEGEENKTNRNYTAGYLTELVSGGNIVNYEYDGKGRTSVIRLNDDPYASYEYKDRGESGTADTVTATIAPTDSASSYTVMTESDKDGNLLRMKEGKNPLSLADSLVNDYFGKEDKDREGLLKTREDKTIGTKTDYSYNSLRQPLSATVRDSATNTLISSETAEYDEYGQIAKRRIVFGNYTQEYGYRYKDNFERELESISMPYGLENTQVTDVNGRLKERGLCINGTPLSREYYYFRKHGDHGTNQISSVRYGERRNGQFVIKDGVSYTYDASGNICEVKENGKLSARYGYDKLNRLIREDNAKLSATTLYSYDNNGNILSQRETAFTLRDTEKLTEFTDEREYVYDADRPDRLIAFGDENILGYDSIGNPSYYRGKRLSWQKGRQLASVTDNVETIAFSYDANGRRMQKIAEGERTKYFYVGNMLIREERADENNIVYLGDDLLAGDNAVEGDGIVTDSVNKSVIEYIYGQSGVAGLVYNGVKYYFRRNVQGDVTRIYAIDGTLTACYTYDAWGNHKVCDANGNENTDIEFIGNVNPYRYRGYYYDVETRLYYCESRYYDPEVGRWINADDISYIDPETINGLNLYSYCGNNPVMMVDPSGCIPWWNWLLSAIQIVVGGALVATGVGAGFGAMLLTSGAIGMVSNALGSTIGGGIGSMTNGFGAISTGISMLSFGIPGIIAGIGMIAVGAGTMIMGANEVVSGITGTNYMRDWMGGSLYDGLYIGLNITSAVGTIAGRLGMRAVGTKTIGSHDVLKAKGQHPYARITKGKNIYNFDARGNVYWSKHNIGMTNTGSPSGLHWHTSLGRDNNHIYSYIKLIIKLIFGGK